MDAFGKILNGTLTQRSQNRKMKANMFCLISVELGELLEQAVNVTWPDGIVKVIRTDQRRGVAGARMVGIEYASGDIILSLDAHIEVFPGW